MNLIEIIAKAIAGWREFDTPDNISPEWDTDYRRALAALRALDEAGYVCVPKEPTARMKGAGMLCSGTMGNVYKAMLAARPDVEGGDA